MSESSFFAELKRRIVCRAARTPLLAAASGERLLASLHDDPRWLPFLRKIGYVPGQMARVEFKVTVPQ